MRSLRAASMHRVRLMSGKRRPPANVCLLGFHQFSWMTAVSNWRVPPERRPASASYLPAGSSRPPDPIPARLPERVGVADRVAASMRVTRCERGPRGSIVSPYRCSAKDFSPGDVTLVTGWLRKRVLSSEPRACPNLSGHGIGE